MPIVLEHDGGVQICENSADRQPMPWICTCGTSNQDTVRSCPTCSAPCELARVHTSAPAPASTFGGIAGWKLAAIGGVLVFGLVCGCAVAVAVFGTHDTGQTAQVASSGESKGAFQDAFETSFKSSCRQSAMRSGHVSQAVADRYCECALPIFERTHSMMKAAQTCSQQIRR